MGHTKYPKVVFGDWPASRGYLYGVPTRDAITGDLHVKLGSTRDGDPVFSVRGRYDTILGNTIVWFLSPSADAYRDERAMHLHFEGRRVYPERELFRFGDKQDFERAIADFDKELRAATALETAYKPPTVACSSPQGLKTKQRAQAKMQRCLRRQQSKRCKLEAAKRRKIVTHDQEKVALGHFIDAQCTVGEDQ